ncbi:MULTISPECIES: ISAs1 family transposase [unclassified Frankia]|uniref:ISAs1 family transposase n=1 Tax=unclassified Frankia TaxID=2632575 RepID=UPI002023EDFA
MPPAALLAVFAQVTDPRKRRGTRHQLPILLTLATCAVLAGARSFTAVSEWAANASETVCTALGIARVPDEWTFRRVFARLDADMLDVTLGAWAAAATTPPQGERRRIAVDGKTLQGSRHGDTPGRHLLAARDQHHQVVLAQRAVDAKNNEIPAPKALLSQVEPTGVTGSAIVPEQGPKHPGLVGLRIDLDLANCEPGAVGRRREQVNLAAVGPPCAPGP